MVQIKIKGVNGAYHIYATYHEEQAFLTELINRLKVCLKNRQTFSAYFHFLDFSEQMLLKVINICEELHVIIKGISIQHVLKKEEKISHITNIPSGEEVYLTQTSMILGDMKKDAFVSSSHDIYVIGCARGTFDFLYEGCRLFASSIEADVRICDSVFQNVTNFSPVCVYYVQGKIQISMLKEERMWEKRLR